MKGHLRKRGKSSWSVIISLGLDQHGKRTQSWHTVRGTKKTSAEKNVRDYLERWLDAYAKPNLAAKSYLRYAAICRGHLIPALGNYPLTKLSPLHIEECYAKTREAGRLNGKGALSEQTLLHHHRVLKLALKDGD